MGAGNMTASSAVSVLSKIGQAFIASDNYASDQIDEIITAAAATETEYNSVVWGVGPAVDAGAEECKFGTVGNWWPGGEVDTDGIDVTQTQYWIDQYNASPTGFPFIIDLEAWNIRTETEKAIEQLTLAASMWGEQTDRLIGIYAYIPNHDTESLAALIKSAVDGSSAFLKERATCMLSLEMHLNDYVNARLGPLVDFYVPRCYVYGANEVAKFRYEASQQIIEAKRLAGGKPIYPIWWHSTLAEGFPALIEAEFLDHVKFVTSFPGIAGSVAWTGGEEPAYWAGHVEDLIDGAGAFAVAPPP